ncbi:DUF599 domain-containing protein [Paracoccus panacisoli]|uniref:Membrane protein n=3 Tax=Paracoccus TaxID=265 RepID=A0A099G2N0_9RHOB|nr:DUF599 domain-containing protein [Paracoccus sanguinis]KGJ15596.1 membrane protein [Paracoccus sanguinis]KGJ17079.1 membrane protein [Paracoccus sanguinis]KGJ20154.1 membrane protein [Paracoccus sanguinis]KGJ21980.1 membrane protein [Paracoccus sanguinis]SDX19288.1 Uncharacterized membrane protein [Paracoccus sanguinis]
MPLTLHLPLSLTATDLVALALLLVAWFGTGRLIEKPPASRPSVSMLMRRYRRDWMVQFVHREPRIFDGNILSSLREGTSFYASACMIAIGGGLALIGNTDPLAGIARDLEATEVPSLVWKVKILLVLGFLANAFLKFVWSHRLFGYCAIMMAAVPNDPRAAEAETRARAAAEVNIHAARNFNIGLRAVYFALGAMCWMAGPWALMTGTALVTALTLRREFASGSRRAILADLGDRR